MSSTTLKLVENGTRLVRAPDNAEAKRQADIAKAAAGNAANAVREELEGIRDQAGAAAAASGNFFAFYPTKANATAALSSIPAGAHVQVFVDESANNHHTVYQKSGGVLVLRLDLSAKVFGGNVTVSAPNGGNSEALGSRPMVLESGTGPFDRPVELVQKQGAAGVKHRKQASGHFHEWFLSASDYPDHPVTMIADGGNFGTVAWGTVSGLVWREPGTSRIVYLPASTNFLTNGERVLDPDNPDQFIEGVLGDPYMWSFRSDVGGAKSSTTEFAGNAYDIACYMQSFRHHFSGVELGGWDYEGRLHHGPGGRENHDTSFYRAREKTYAIDSVLRLDPLALANAPSAVGAEAVGSICFLQDGPDGPGFYGSAGAGWVPLIATPAPEPFADVEYAFRSAKVVQSSADPLRFKKTTDDGGDWYQAIFYEANGDRTGDVQVEFTARTNGPVMIGFANSPSDDNDYTGLRFALWKQSTGEISRVVNGVPDATELAPLLAVPSPASKSYFVRRVGNEWALGRLDLGVLFTADATGSGAVSLSSDFNGFNAEIQIEYYGPPR